ncbi:YqaA family protein [Pseudoroseomonas globiformis]|uniref:YqaA family protein n=1 Tax=Teichococcus globiformis TaxID=2307229 RepID=A0ABV7FUH8_9PROT
MLRPLYDHLLRLSAHPRAGTALAGVSFAESSVFPIPPDVMLIPMCLARPDQAYRYAFACTVASVLGGLVGYAIGAFLFEAIALPVLAAYGHADALTLFQSWFDQWGAAVILIKGLTPVPFKIVTIAAGAAHFSLPVFLVCSILTRGARFYLLAWLLRRYGPAATRLIETRLSWIAGGAAAAALLLLLAVRYA